MVDWTQIGEDFRQKYQETFCRYISPLSQRKEVFYLRSIYVRMDAAPTLTLFNKQHGEIYLSYTTEAELDFSFPRSGYFQCNDKALLFTRSYNRQYKKGMCPSTCHITLPYPHCPWQPSFDEDTVACAHQQVDETSISSAIRAIRGGAFSVVLKPTMAVGVGKTDDEFWLWYEDQVVATINDRCIEVKAPMFRQEILDHVRDTQDHARTVI